MFYELLSWGLANWLARSFFRYLECRSSLCSEWLKCSIHIESHEQLDKNWFCRLAYLHEAIEPKVVHRDIKSSNILIDDEFNAKVSDFGLAKLLGSGESHVTTRVMGTFGYAYDNYFIYLYMKNLTPEFSLMYLIILYDVSYVAPEMLTLGYWMRRATFTVLVFSCLKLLLGGTRWTMAALLLRYRIVSIWKGLSTSNYLSLIYFYGELHF